MARSGSKKGRMVSQAPFPDLPAEVRRELVKTSVRARVEIAADGSVKVRLLESSGNREVDEMAIRALQESTWEPGTRNGEPVHSIEIVRFNLQVE